MINKRRKTKEHKPVEDKGNQRENIQKPIQHVSRDKMPGQTGPGAAPERSSDRNTKGKARP